MTPPRRSGSRAQWGSRCLIGAVVSLLAGCASVAPAAHPGSSGTPSSSARPSAPAGYQALVLHDGDTVTASGRVVSVPGKPVRFCAPVAEGGVGYAPGHEPAPQWCPLGVDVTGVDLAVLTQRRSKDGATEGQAELTGIYRNLSVRVTRQGPPNYPPTSIPADQPPCPAPAGGWPHGATGENIDVDPIMAYSVSHPGLIVTVALLRPSANQTLVLVLTSADPGPIRARFQARFGKQLCVTRSLYNRSQIAAARAAIDYPVPAVQAAGFISSGEGVSPHGQVSIELSTMRVTDQLARLASAQVPGLIALKPWLAPA